MNAENLKSRHILSFAKRDSRLTRGQKEALDSLAGVYVLPADKITYDFTAIFGNINPVVLEIGFGIGSSLLEQAIANPNLNFVGVEVYQSGVAKLLMGIKEHNLSNIKIISIDALVLLQSKLSAGSIAKVQLFFPDPWPKARHHKRRIVRDIFLTAVHKILSTGGVLHIATDWENYAESISEEVAKTGLYHEITAEDYLKAEYFQNLKRPTTKFEQRGLSLGHKIYEFYYQKTII